MRSMFALSSLILMATACSLSPFPLDENQDEVTMTQVGDAISPSEPAPSTSTPEGSQPTAMSMTPVPSPEFTATYYPTRTPTQLAELEFDILDVRTFVAEDSNRLSIHIVGKAHNNTGITLDSARVQLRVYENGDLTQRVEVTDGFCQPTLPGEVIAFVGQHYIPNPAEGLEFQVHVYGEPISTSYDFDLYRQLEVAGVQVNPRSGGSMVEVRVANTGDQHAYPELHFFFYDQAGSLADAGFIAVDQELMVDGIHPGKVGSVSLFAPVENPETEFIILGFSGGS